MFIFYIVMTGQGRRASQNIKQLITAPVSHQQELDSCINVEANSCGGGAKDAQEHRIYLHQSAHGSLAKSQLCFNPSLPPASAPPCDLPLSPPGMADSWPGCRFSSTAQESWPE